MTVMAGAFVTQVTHGRNGIGELVFMTMLGIVAYGRWPGVLASVTQPFRAGFLARGQS
jgi:hypothetical protein